MEPFSFKNSIRQISAQIRNDEAKILRLKPQNDERQFPNNTIETSRKRRVFPRFGQYRSGFTLLEIMIVVAIVGIISLVFVWGYTGYTERARDLARKTALQNIARAVETHHRENYGLPLPTSISDTNAYVSATSSGGQALEHISGSGVLWYKGTFGAITYGNVKNVLSQHYTDPKTRETYTYFVDSNKIYYYLEAKMEL